MELFNLIPYGKQDINQNDIDAVLKVLKSDFLTQGPQVPKFERKISSYCCSDFAIAVNSATSALHLACLALNLGKGDILWTSPNSFVASANCALYCGAKVDFVDIDEFGTQNIAYMASNADENLLATPDNDVFSMSIVYPDNTSETHVMDEDSITAWHLTIGAFDGAGINYSSTKHPQFGHFFSSFNDEDPALDNWSWYWELHTWNDSSVSWEYSQLGVDSIEDPQYIAWARNTTADSDIPIPGAVQSLIDQQSNQVCDGHGWEMGSGSGKHCMCDQGYEWPDGTMLSCVAVEVEEEYTVGHSTTTFILDSERKPRVAWTGDNWKPSDFIQDIETLAEVEGLIDTSEETPGLTFAVALMSLGAAAIAINVRSKPNEEEN